MDSRIVLLLILLVIGRPCSAEETKYPPVLQRLKERYEPLRLQQKSQLDAVEKIAKEMEGFNAKLAARMPGDIPPAGRHDDSLFNLSIHPFPHPQMGGMDAVDAGERSKLSASVPSDFRTNQILLFAKRWAGYEELKASHLAQKYAFAQIVAEKLTRDDLEQIVEYPWNHEYLLKSEAVGFFEFAIAVATEIALRETSNQKMRVVIETSPVSFGLGPFLIDLYHDERSFKILSRMATSHNFPGDTDIFPGDTDLGPKGLMLGYDPPADFRAKLEAKRLANQALSDHEKRLIASWLYADSLLPEDEAKYLDFERRIHAAICISPDDGNISPVNFLRYGARFFLWKDGDDRFLAHESKDARRWYYYSEIIRAVNPELRAQLNAGAPK